MKNKPSKKNPAWWILGSTLVIYFIFFIFKPEIFHQASGFFFKLLIRIIPALLVVYLAMFLINLLVKPQKIARHLGEDSGTRGILISMVAGILSTGPIYVWYPLLKDLREKGMTNMLITIFLYNRAVKIPLLPMMIYYFGLQFTVILTILMIVFSVINGWAVNVMIRK